NAIKRDRIAHAYLMTGVRGVGKTSTARLIAKALNCIGPEGQGGPTIDPCGVCEPCRAIAEGRHIDVIEMDAASHTGVDDVREIIEAVRYASVSARYKIYIIDEVHMLSKNAFNALLKTLEEPPAHVKFLFATTEIDKVPVTVLSRCQRFDLRRIPADVLAKHFGWVAAQEGVTAEPEALALIAAAAEGSVRDGLSILDQAIAHADGGAGVVEAAAVRAMLGLSDRGAIRALWGQILAGEAQAMLGALANQYELGVDPAAVLRGLLAECHAITRAKVDSRPDPRRSAEDQAALDEQAKALSFALLHRLWQMLLKGHDEVARAPDPQLALEMALLRLVYASSLPDPAQALGGSAQGAGVSDQGSHTAPAAGESQAPLLALPADYAALLVALEKRGKHSLALSLHDHASVVEFAPPALVLHMARPMSAEFARDLAAELKAATGAIWAVSLSDTPGAPTLKAQEDAAEAAAHDAILAHPIVAAALEAFPGAELMLGNR
ncbi:MAG: DNA polymerase III subunit gamma/tau, partial [Alphaproteobacteria bacterium]|nr:DNA polymerase III subunit gamma/tau [Alphaproteobacteria bacterium]